MNCSNAAPSVSFQDVVSMISAVGSVMATLLLFFQCYVDHHRSEKAGEQTPVGILVATLSGPLTVRPRDGAVIQVAEAREAGASEPGVGEPGAGT